MEGKENRKEDQEGKVREIEHGVGKLCRVVRKVTEKMKVKSRFRRISHVVMNFGRGKINMCGRNRIFEGPKLGCGSVLIHLSMQKRKARDAGC